MKKKIERIILFGDSFVEGQGAYTVYMEKNPCNEGGMHGKQLKEWRKKNTWEKYLKKYFPNTEVVNYANQGSDNYSQFLLLDKLIPTLSKNDLVLFGFTSKYRDYNSIKMGFQHRDENFLHEHNPLISTPIAHEKISITDKFGIDGYQHNFYNNEEKEFTYQFLKKWLVYTFDEIGYERVAQTNYLFYSEYAKMKGLNIHFFDLFEPYVTPKFNDNLDIDTDIYFTYNDEDLHTYVDRYEKENGTYNDEVSYWECGLTQPIANGKIYHPNQHGYELWINYMYERWLSKWYE